MSFKIDYNSKINSSFEGPSKGYFEAKNRFDEILKQKLNINPTPSVGQYTNGINSSASSGSVSENVRIPSGATAKQIDDKLFGTEMEGLGQSFVNAEQKYGVNAWFLAGLGVHESAYGTSKIAQDKNNLFGFQAYDASPYASAQKFSNKEESIDTVAKYLSEQYLSTNGTYYNGVSIDAIGKRYATDPNWSNAIKIQMANLMQD